MIHLRDFLEREYFRILMNLPRSLQFRLSGQSPIVHGENRLSSQLQLMLALRARRMRKPLHEISLEQARRSLSRDCRVHSRKVIRVGKVSDVTIPAPHGEIRARHYSPRASRSPGSTPPPLLVFFHGGGFALCDLETHDAPCRFLCRRMGMHILSVDYRLAPEFPFPAALEDAQTALRWAQDNAQSLGADPEQVAVGGDSAGANLAAVVSQLTAAENSPMPSAQFLLYPITDQTRHYESMDHFAEGFFLTRKDIEYFRKLYAPNIKVPHFTLFPMIFESLADLPPAVIATAGFDPLRDEGEAYGEALKKAGVSVECIRLPSMIHGFLNFMEFSSDCENALALAADRFSNHILNQSNQVRQSRARI